MAALIVMPALLVMLLAGCAQGSATPSPVPATATEVDSAAASPTLPSAAESPGSATAPATASEPATAEATPAGEEATATSEPDLSGGYPAVAAIVGDLRGLPLETFFEESFKQLLLRTPETITELGLEATYGIYSDRLNNLSDDYLRETQALESAILALLRTYDREALSPEEQLSYDIYDYYLDDLVRGHPYLYHNYPVSYFVTSAHVSLIQFFAELHPLESREDAERYLTRLEQVDEKFDQLLEGLRIREELGIIPPRFVFEWTLPDLRRTADSAARDTEFYTAFVEKLDGVAGLSDGDRRALAAEAEAAIAESVLPAFQELADYMAGLQRRATDEIGAASWPEGESAYAYLLRHHTTSELSADEIHELGLRELERIHAEMRVRFDALGYPVDEDFPALFGRVARDGGILTGEEILAGYEAIIADAQQRVGPAFDLMPQAEVIVIGVPFGGYYLQPAADGSRPGAFYATYSGTETRYSMPTLAYHEAVPGHHFQLAIMQELEGLPAFRKGVIFTAYVEGWALYAERLAAELGFYEGDPYGDLGRLQAEAFRAARLVVDTGIHDRGWSFEEAVAFMTANIGQTRSAAQGQVARYVVWPGQATAYLIGMNQFLASRQVAMEAQGDDFDLRAFHNLLLTNGSMPLEIMAGVVREQVGR